MEKKILNRFYRSPFVISPSQIPHHDCYFGTLYLPKIIRNYFALVAIFIAQKEYKSLVKQILEKNSLESDHPYVNAMYSSKVKKKKSDRTQLYSN